MERSPEVEARAVLDGLHPALENVLGSEALEQVEHLCGNVQLMLAAPKTYRAHHEDILAGGAQPPWAPPATALWDAVRVLGRMEVARANSVASALAHPAGAALNAYLKEAKARIGARALTEVLTAVEQPRIETIVKAGAMSATQAEAPRFETHVTMIVDEIVHMVEYWYRPMLAAVLNITRRVRGRKTAVPSMVGALMSQCRDAWKGGLGPVAILVDEARLIRNAKSHTGVELDPRVETITFVNRASDGVVTEQVGPWSRSEFGTFATHFIQTCFAIATILREVQGATAGPVSRRERREEARKVAKKGPSSTAVGPVTPPPPATLPDQVRATIDALIGQSEALTRTEDLAKNLERATDHGDRAEAGRLMIEILKADEQGTVYAERRSAALRAWAEEIDRRMRSVLAAGQRAEEVFGRRVMHDSANYEGVPPEP